jgi:death-on-curing protein
MTDYLTLADVLFLHHDQVERYGGAHGVRDMGAVEAAVFRPQSGYYEDVIAEAAALMESLAMNHPFIDGNKRVAFAATYAFLKINRFEIKQTVNAVYEQMMTFFESNTFEFASLEPWLRSIAKKI